MVEFIPYFAAFIMVLFGAAFYMAMITFRELTEEESDRSPQKPSAPKPIEPSVDEPNRS